MLSRINKFKDWHAAIIITVLGFAVYFDGLKNQFLGDDLTQIVDNPTIRSLTNIRLFFEGGTFYNGQGGVAILTGYYRPLMTTVFSFLYTLFGSQPLAFHLVQLMLCIASTIILYLLFKFFFSTALSLVLSLIFLIHPLDSQVVFYIAQMQDVLFFFFGILAMYLLFRTKSFIGLVVAVLCIFLSLLSKETGVVFIAMSILFLMWQDRKRLFQFLSVLILPVVLYLTLRIHAVGVNGTAVVGPIDKLNLLGRLFTMPSIMLFYISKLVFPWRLASEYYWAHPSFSFRYFLLPLVIELLIASVLVYVGLTIRKKDSKRQYYTYLFFFIWFFVGMMPSLQIIPLDTTVSEPWFYFSMVGAIGMVGAILVHYRARIRRIDPYLLIIIGVLIIGMLGARTVIRGLDWRNQYTLATKDAVASPEDYTAFVNISSQLLSNDNYAKAQQYALHSVNIFPSYLGYYNLAVSSGYLGDYSEVKKADDAGLNLVSGLGLLNSIYFYQNLGGLTIVYGNYSSNKLFLTHTLDKLPLDSSLWMDLAIIEDNNGENSAAKSAITKAINFGQIPGSIYGLVPQSIYNDIIANKSFAIDLVSLDRSMVVQ